MIVLGLWLSFGLVEESIAAKGKRDLRSSHAKTGFSLTGGHARVACENCHVQGVFKGTPTKCMVCHTTGGRISASFKPANHIPTVANCGTCHRTTRWTPASFRHSNVKPGSCSTCHNGNIATGKSDRHLPTTASCDSCHRTIAWTPAAFRHVGVKSGTCSTCHNGRTAAGKPGLAEGEEKRKTALSAFSLR